LHVCDPAVAEVIKRHTKQSRGGGARQAAGRGEDFLKYTLRDFLTICDICDIYIDKTECSILNFNKKKRSGLSTIEMKI
jgi:hypothetical protein